MIKDKAVSVPPENLDTLSVSGKEDKDASAQWCKPHLLTDYLRQAIYAISHINLACTQIIVHVLV